MPKTFILVVKTSIVVPRNYSAIVEAHLIEIIKVIPAGNFAGTKRCCVIVKDTAVDKLTAMTDKFLTEYQKRRFRRIFPSG